MSEGIIKNFHNYVDDKKVKYALNKSVKPKRLKTQDMVIDSLFQKLELTRNSDGQVVDTRFPKEVQNYIRYYLQSKGVEYNDTGYLSLRSACYQLSSEERLQLCININAKYDYGLNIETEMKDAKGFFNSFKTASAITLGGAAIGTAAGGVLNAVNPTLLPNAVANYGKEAIGKKLQDPNFQQELATSAKNAVNEYIDNNAEGIAQNLADSAGQFAHDNLPSFTEQGFDMATNMIDESTMNGLEKWGAKKGIGLLHDPITNNMSSLQDAAQAEVERVLTDGGNIETAKQAAKDAAASLIDQEMPNIANQAEQAAGEYIDNAVAQHTLPINLISAGLMGLATGAITAATKSLYDIAKNAVKRAKDTRQSKAILELDNELYAKENLEEAEKIKQSLHEEGIEVEENYQTARAM